MAPPDEPTPPLVLSDQAKNIVKQVATLLAEAEAAKVPYRTTVIPDFEGEGDNRVFTGGKVFSLIVDQIKGKETLQRLDNFLVG